LRFWVDVDNPPQVQYLVPLAEALRRAGAEVVVTARDDGITFQLLRERDVEFQPVGRSFGKGMRRKAVGLARRTGALVSAFRRGPRPLALVSSSRSSALAARLLGIPSFVVCDYEHADLRIYRFAGSTIVHPDVIGGEEFARQGFDASRLLPFEGLKEDLTFADVDVDRVPAHRFDAEPALARVLFRPPAQETHYYSSASGRLASELLAHLARQRSPVVVFSPRYDWQRESLRGLEWANDPIVLERAVPFVSLLKGVDLVISSGGTMLREAAWLGLPAYSIFMSKVGAVDRHLESLGRLAMISSADMFDRIEFARTTALKPRLEHPGVLDRLAGAIVERAAARPR
jgi:predicted glycosyltransferase